MPLPIDAIEKTQKKLTALHMLKGGASYSDIVQAGLCNSKPLIHYWAKCLGVRSSARGRGRPSGARSERTRAILDLLAQGKGQGEVARKLNVSKQWISQVQAREKKLK